MRSFDYLTACKEASKAQGIDDIVSALQDLGINASSEQTGGFTMCAYVKLSGDLYIYANKYGASVYSEDEYLFDIAQADEEQDPRHIAKQINNYIFLNS
jgi:hypothetical protein